MYTNNVKQSSMKQKVYALLLILVGVFFATNTAHAGTVGPVGGPYVPVYDETTNTNFEEYINKFDQYAQNFDQSINTNTDSLKNIITGSDPGGEAKIRCAQIDSYYKANSYTNGAWASSSAELGYTNLPFTVPDEGINTPGTPASAKVQINGSASLRCLLQEIVEWQKLGLSLQIHALLKSYISDAQTKQLNNQLLNQIAAANLNWAKAGNEVDNNGIISSEPVYSTNRSQSEYNVKGRQLDHIADQASADPTAGNPVGSLGICQPWRLDTASNLVNNSQAQVIDPSNGIDSKGTSCELNGVLDPNDYSKYTESFNNPASPHGGVAAFVSILSNPGNSPLGASTAADAAALGRLKRQQESTRLENASSGFRPTKQCSGDPSDPYCLDEQNSIAVTPAGQNQANVTEVAQQGNRQVHDGNTLDATAGSSTEQQSTTLNTQTGLLGYDETGLATSKTAVNKLVQEFYDVIRVGYFGLDTNPSLTAVGSETPTAQWAQATMLMIYDEMKFNADNPQVVVTQSVTQPLDTQY